MSLGDLNGARKESARAELKIGIKEKLMATVIKNSDGTFSLLNPIPISKAGLLAQQAGKTKALSVFQAQHAKAAAQREATHAKAVAAKQAELATIAAQLEALDAASR